MGRRMDPEEADALFRAHGLEPLTPYVRASDEREATCTRCGTWRRVKTTTLKRPGGGYPCRWCHGWETWRPWSEEVRGATAAWREIRGVEFSLARIIGNNLIPLTPVGDEFTPVGCLCPDCGETVVTVPERISPSRPGWYGCQRCSAAAAAKDRDEAAAVFKAGGMRLLGRLSGLYVKQPVECLTCGTRRQVSLAAVRAGTAPLCWTCTHGIRPDEPHRVYLFRFPALGVRKVGITHNRHSRRLIEHQVNGGVLVADAEVPDRAAARAVEAWVLARMSAHRAPQDRIGPVEFPQGGWTETWVEDGAPDVDLPALCAQLTATSAAAVPSGGPSSAAGGPTLRLVP